MIWKLDSIENGLQHEVLLDRKWGLRVRGEVATGGWARLEPIGMPRSTEPHHRSWRVFLGAAGGIKKKSYKETKPVGKTGGQVAARKKRMSTCRPFVPAKTMLSASARALLRLRPANNQTSWPTCSLRTQMDPSQADSREHQRQAIDAKIKSFEESIQQLARGTAVTHLLLSRFYLSRSSKTYSPICVYLLVHCQPLRQEKSQRSEIL